MALRLRPMTDAEIGEYVERSRESYVAAQVEAGETAESARAHAERGQAGYLPSDTPAPGHRLYRLVDGAEPVGTLWVGPAPSGTPDTAWVFDVTIDADRRGQGYGRAAMVLAEQDAREHGSTRLGLNVFGHNTVARGLYESLGFEPTRIAMVKRLPDDHATEARD